MRRDWIMTDYEREEKKKKIQENRRKKSSETLFQSENSNSSCEEIDKFSNNQASGNKQIVSISKIHKPIRRRRRKRAHTQVDKTNIQNFTTRQLSKYSYKKETNNKIKVNIFNEKKTTKIPNKIFKKCFTSKKKTVAKNAFYSEEVTFKDINRSISENFRFFEKDELKFSKTADKKESTDGCSINQTNYVSTIEPDTNSTKIISLNKDNLLLSKVDEYIKEMKFNSFNNISESYNKKTILEPIKFFDEYSSFLASTNRTPISMSEVERQQVKAINEAYKQAIRLVIAQGTPKNPEDINTTINVTELGVRRIIFYFKLLPDFRNLEHDLMVKLLKHNMMSLLQIHGVNSYNIKENTFQEPNTDDTPFSANSLEIVYGPEIYKLIMSITTNLYNFSQNDMTHIKILMLIVLFDPSNENLSKCENHDVKKLMYKYISLLYSFMKENFGKEKSAFLLKAFLFEVNRINDLACWFEKAVIEKSNYDFIRPLMKEVFSIPSDTSPYSMSTNVSTSMPNSLFNESI
jgi:hypothetical protein